MTRSSTAWALDLDAMSIEDLQAAASRLRNRLDDFEHRADEREQCAAALALVVSAIDRAAAIPGPADGLFGVPVGEI